MELSVRLMRIFTRVFRICPVKRDKIVLTAYNGRQYSCNPKYLTEALVKNGNFRIYYALAGNRNPAIPEQVTVVKYRSIKHFYHLMTAGYIVVNSSGLSNLLPYRKSQTLINTWHGGGYFKTIGDDFFTSKSHMQKRKISGKNTKYILASCEVFAEQLPRSMKVSEDAVVRCGLPRDDLFFSDTSKIKEKVCKHFKIDADTEILLYAPTYRDGKLKSIHETEIEALDVDGTIESLEKRFGKKFVFMFRAHHDMIPENLSEKCVNASDYDDMQELLAAASAFITDYSSCMWDFSLQKKPGFLYAPDLEKYASEHPLGTKPEDWPFEIYKTNKSLQEAILSYDEESGNRKIEHYLKVAGSYEDGHASERVIELITGKK